jgi:hypothetical protein
MEFKGRHFQAEELELIREVVADCRGLSQQELAHTVCELLGWRRLNGKLKTWEAKQLLQQMEAEQGIGLPRLRATKPLGGSTAIPEPTVEATPLEASLAEVGPIRLHPVERAVEQRLFRELVGHYHYLGYRMAFGAQLRYLIEVAGRRPRWVGCVQLSSGAWRIGVRDRWIGWDEARRRRHLQRIVTHSRFLILPWIRVPNLASHVLGRMVREFPAVWEQRFGLVPWLIETLVDSQRYAGTCYQAANWRYLGQTQGRGRQDRHHRRQGRSRKKVFVYPLHPQAQALLRGESRVG